MNNFNLQLLEERNKLIKRNIEQNIIENEKMQKELKSGKIEACCQETVELAQECVKQIPFEPYQFFLLFGMGNGKLVYEIAKYMCEGSILMVYEPCKEIFLYNMEQDEFGEILKNDKILWSVKGLNDSEFVYMYGENMQDIYLSRTLLLEHPYYRQLMIEKEEYMELVEKGKDYHQTLNNSRKLFSKECYENVVHGTRKLNEVKSVDELRKAIPTDTFVVAVAAGPSLKEAVPILKQYREKVFIVAVYRAVDYLLENDVIPDLITTIDYQQEVMLNKNEKMKAIPILLPEHASPQIWDEHKGVKFLASYSSYCKNILEQCQIQTTNYLLQPSVAVWQLAIMIEFGIERMALVGQDLAYSEGNSHVGNIKETKYNTGKTLQGVDGNLVPTREDWIIYKMAIEVLLRSHPEAIVYDTKKTGALIRYTQLTDLEELIKTYGKCEREAIREKIELAPFLINENNEEKLKEMLDRSLENIEKMRNKSRCLIELSEKICMGVKNTAWKEKAIQEISEINVWMDEQIEMELILSYVESETEDLAEELLTYTGDARKDEYNTYMYLKQYYEYILNGLDNVKKQMDKYR